MPFHEGAVLVGSGVDLQFLFAIQNQPGPTGSKACGCSSSEFFEQNLVGGEGFFQLSNRLR